MGARGTLQSLLRSAADEDALAAVLLPLYRALDRGRHPVRPLRWADSLRRRQGLARDRGGGHGPSSRARDEWHRSLSLSGLRLLAQDRSPRDAQIRHSGLASVL